ncbi:hypothetical protein E1265_31635 [Streptomyces sp. 8K308]|uniref:hypothetical protein n=1 Tax=Streptomyces sp. 8K308 TaxID=2530388 RepID=UPI0010497A0F|nr:hypothetical protein [Streptomyces sp. 8K308]TDC10142.1 hypothetical protein E1265_31635 [Streptomyces sp. 8K308]
MPERPDVARLLREAAEGHLPDRERMLARMARGAPRRASRPGVGWSRVLGAVVALVVTLGAASLAVRSTGVGGGGDGEPPAAAPVLSASGRVNAGSNPYWSQSDLTVVVGRPLTSLSVELRVVAGDGVRDTGAWRTLPEEDFELTTRLTDDLLVFRWELRPGAAVPAGEHVFAGQYDHDLGARDASGDRFLVEGTGPEGPVSASGAFG